MTRSFSHTRPVPHARVGARTFALVATLGLLAPALAETVNVSTNESSHVSTTVHSSNVNGREHTTVNVDTSPSAAAFQTNPAIDMLEHMHASNTVDAGTGISSFGQAMPHQAQQQGGAAAAQMVPSVQPQDLGNSITEFVEDVLQQNGIPRGAAVVDVQSATILSAGDGTRSASIVDLHDGGETGVFLNGMNLSPDDNGDAVSIVVDNGHVTTAAPVQDTCAGEACLQFTVDGHTVTVTAE